MSCNLVIWSSYSFIQVVSAKKYQVYQIYQGYVVHHHKVENNFDLSESKPWCSIVSQNNQWYQPSHQTDRNIKKGWIQQGHSTRILSQDNLLGTVFIRLPQNTGHECHFDCKSVSCIKDYDILAEDLHCLTDCSVNKPESSSQ